MRIALSNSRIAFGGGENWSLTASAGLAARGHDVFLYCHPNSVLRRRAEALDSDVHIVPLRVRGTGDLIGVAQGLSLLRKHRVEILCANMEREVRILGLAARMAGVPLVRRRGSDRGFKNSWGNRVTFERLTAGVIVNSDATKNSVLTKNAWVTPSKVVRIYNGIPDRFFPDPDAGARFREGLGIETDEQVIGIVGALSRRKGHATLFEAFANLRDTRSSLRLVVVGWVPDTSRAAGEAQEIHAACDRLGIRESTLFIPRTDDPNAVYNGLDVLAMPSTNEGFGYVAAEAMRAGTPVVVSDASSLPEVVGTEDEGGFIAPAGDAAAWAGALGRLLDDETLRAEQGQKGAARVRSVFTMDKMLAEVETFFARVARR